MQVFLMNQLPDVGSLIIQCRSSSVLPSKILASFISICDLLGIFL
jgi:hypothetical protein